MNSVNHPHGSGKGRALISRKKKNTQPFGLSALARRSRKRNNILSTRQEMVLSHLFLPLKFSSLYHYHIGS